MSIEMDSLTSVVAIAIAILLGAMSPGPSFVVVARTAVSKSRGHGVATALGMGIGGAILAALALLGLHLVLAAVPSVYRLLQVAGALYLLFIAYKIWTSADEPLVVASDKTAGPGSIIQSVVHGTATQLSNPKTAIVYASVFSAALAQAPSGVMAAALAGIIFVIEFGWYAVVAVAFSTDRARETYLRSKARVDRLAASAMGLLGVKILAEARSA
jgi:threonine/homoserine/homoserine lactone efflux protein